MLRYVATCRPSKRDETYPKAAAPAYAARLVLNIDIDYASTKLHAAVVSRIEKARQATRDNPQAPAGSVGLDPFDKVALVNTYFLAKHKVPEFTAAKIKEYVSLYAHRTWRGYGAMNYRLMMDGAGYLAAEHWPDLVDADGLTAAEIQTATRGRLLDYFAGICRQNYSEYGCPIYSAVNLSAVRMLAEFARDPVVRHRATLTLDAMLVDIACSWNQGYNVGTAARAKYWGSTDTSPEAMGATAAAAWIWFGAPRAISAEGIGWIHSVWMAMPGQYQLPQIIVRVAQERSQPSRYRGSVPAMKQDQICRTTYHSPSFSLCSQWDHPPSPTAALYKESRRNMLKWISPARSSTFAVCMENPRRPYNLREGVANPLGYGENPYSQFLQHQGTLIGVYAVPADYPYFRLYAPFTKSGAIIRRFEESGWVFCHHGSMLMGFYCAQPWRWDMASWNNNDLLWCDERQNAWVVETAELAQFAGGGVEAELRRFANAILRNTQIEASLDSSTPSVHYRNLSGDKLSLTWLPHGTPYTNQAQINGQPVDYAAWPLHDSPWVHQHADGTTLRIEHNKRVLLYDFVAWTREEIASP